MNIYCSTIRNYYCPRMMKDYFINKLNRGQHKTIVSRKENEIDFEKHSKNGKLSVICYEIKKNEAHIFLNHYWMKSI